MWKGSDHWSTIATGFVFSFHEEGQQLPFPFDKYGPSSDKAEAVLPQDDVAVLHHLGAEQDATFEGDGRNQKVGRSNEHEITGDI